MKLIIAPDSYPSARLPSPSQYRIIQLRQPPPSTGSLGLANTIASAIEIQVRKVSLDPIVLIVLTGWPLELCIPLGPDWASIHARLQRSAPRSMTCLEIIDCGYITDHYARYLANAFRLTLNETRVHFSAILRP